VPAVTGRHEFTGWIRHDAAENRSSQRRRNRLSGDFIAHYVLPVLYPNGLTRGDQLVLGGVALTINIAIYAAVLARHRRTTVKKHMIGPQ
jgi:hypothetical protein